MWVWRMRWGTEGHSGFDCVSRWRITTVEPVLSGLRWRRFDHTGRIIRPSTHIAGWRFSRHHGEEGCGGKSVGGKKKGSAEARGKLEDLLI